MSIPRRDARGRTLRVRSVTREPLRRRRVPAALSPATGDDQVVAYRYHGSAHDLITIVNIDDAAPRIIPLTLRTDDARTSWTDLIDGAAFHASATRINGINLAPAGIRVLLRT